MAGKSINILISTIFKATGIDAAKRAMANMGKTIGRNLANIKAGFDLAASGIKTFISALSKGMAFERMTLQFKQLTGSMEDAKRHMKDLQDLGRTPPFDIESFAAASREMMKMSGGILGFKSDLEIVGDMAAATGNDIAAVGRAFGTAYQIIRDGQSFGRAGQQLFQLGILTKKQVEEFDALSKSGANNAEVWAKLSEEFSRYKGAMAETEKTTQGLVDAIQGEANVAITNFSSAIAETAKPALEGLLGWMKRINEDGTIEDWAESCCESLTRVAEGAKPVIEWLGKGLGVIWNSIKGLAESTAQGIGNTIGTLAGGGGIGDAFSAGLSGWKQGWTDAFYADGAEAEYTERKKEERRTRKAKERADANAKAEAEAEARIAEDLAAAQEKTNKRLAEEKAKADAEAAAKAADAERKTREKLEADLHKQRLSYAKEELAASQKRENAANTTISSAQTEFDKAFAMYRDKDLAASTIAEERDYAADYKRLNKDAAKYGGKWRIDELASLMAAGDTQGQASKLEEWRKSKKFTPEVEAMVRASAADQTKTTAEAELRKIEANTADLARKLDELLSMK